MDVEGKIWDAEGYGNDVEIARDVEGHGGM